MQEDTNNEANDEIKSESEDETKNEIDNEINNETTNEVSSESNNITIDETDIDDSTGEAASEIYELTNNGPAPTITPLPKPKKQKLIIIAALILIGFGILQLGQIIAANMNPKAYLTKAWYNTIKGYVLERDTMISNNPVLKKYKEITAGPSQHRLAVDSGYITNSLMGMSDIPSFNLDFLMTNDPERKQYQFGTDFPLIGGAYFYLSDQEAIISFLGENYTLDAKRAGEEIRTFLDNNGLNYDESVMPRDLDISYSAITKPLSGYKADEVTQGYGKVWLQYSAEWKKLYDAAKLVKSKGTVELGDEEVKCTVMILTFGEQDIREWLTGLYEMAKEDEELERLLFNTYEDVLEILEEGEAYENGDITAEIFIYKDNIIETVVSSASGDMKVGFAARGKEYRLDNIEIFAASEGEEVLFSMQGNHVGKGIFDSRIAFDEESVLITWNPEESADNVSVLTPDGENITFTLALDQDGVIIKPFSGSGSDTLIIKAYPVQSGAITWPMRSTPLKDLNLQELMAKMNIFG